MDKIKIEKNIPMPGSKSRGKWQDVAARMKPGESVWLSNGTQKSGLFNAIKKSGGVAVSRKELAGYRVWRKK
ncbi:MAG: hypothetical protein ACPGFY_09570 [Candidatus Puniceispirillaceae bacterium]